MMPNVSSMLTVLQRSKPRGIVRLLNHVTIYVRCAIRPPNRSTLAQGDLRSVDLLPGLLPATVVSNSHCDSLCAPRSHELRGQALPLFIRQFRIAAAPQTPTHDEVAAVRGDGIVAHRKVWIACLSFC